MAHENVHGWGIDRRIADRPGYRRDEPRVDHDTLGGVAPWTTTIRLRGLSGLLRRAAYRIPDWKARHWLLLLFADRVDVVESKLRLRNLLVGGGVAGVLAALARRRRRARALCPP
jgi:hypothetical protein